MENETSQKSLVWNFIIGKGGSVTTNQLRDFGHNFPMADATKRARELYKEGKLGRRWATEEELVAQRLQTDVMIYFIPAEPQEVIYPEKKERIFI